MRPVIILLVALLVSVQPTQATQVGAPAALQEYIEQGDDFLNEDKLDEAIEAYRIAIKLAPDSSQAHQRLARALSLNGDLDEALRENLKAIELDAQNPLAHSNLGWVLGMQKRYREAAAAERTAIRLDPDNVQSYVTLGLALASVGDYDGAAAANEKAIELDPDNVRAYVNLGATLGRKGDFPGAINAYRKALHLEPHSVAAHLGLGAALGKTGQLKEQIEEFKYAVMLAPDSDNAHGKLGWALYKAGDWQGALKEGYITNWIRLQESGPEYLQKLVSVWGLLFLLFGLIFGVIFFGSRFKPEPEEVIIKSYFLVFHKDKPGRFVFTNRRLVFVPESFSRWFGSQVVSIDRDHIAKMDSTLGRRSFLTIEMADGSSYKFSMPALVLKPLLAGLSQASMRVRTKYTTETAVNLEAIKALAEAAAQTRTDVPGLERPEAKLSSPGGELPVSEPSEPPEPTEDQSQLPDTFPEGRKDSIAPEAQADSGADKQSASTPFAAKGKDGGKGKKAELNSTEAKSTVEDVPKVKPGKSKSPKSKVKEMPKLKDDLPQPPEADSRTKDTPAKNQAKDAEDK